MFDQNLEIRNFLKKIGVKEEYIELRRQNLKKFFEIGFPSKKQEDWKFLDLGKIISEKIPNLKYINDEVFENVDYKNKIQQLGFNIGDYNHIIFVNGFIKKIDLKYEDSSKINVLRNNIDKYEDDKSLTFLNNALLFDYIKLFVKDNYIFNKPLIIVNVSNNRIYNTNFNQRIDIEIGKNSTLSTGDINLNSSKNNFFNFFKNITLNEGSILKNYVLDPFKNENLSYSNTKIDLAKNSISENFILSTGSNFSKNEILCNLNQEYSSAFINGVINIDNESKHEIRTKINHLSENTKSFQLIKCALKNQAKAVYQGKIFVDSVAQKTDGYQLSKAILLDKETEFNGKPELEIYADDVRCSHGSSSGNLDENKIFYLMTRGLNKNEAKKILLDGYFLEVIDKITDEEIKKISKILLGIKE